MANEKAFAKALQMELNNITLPGEGEKVALLQKVYQQYQRALQEVVGDSLPLSQRRQHYFDELLPLFDRIKGTANEILQMNQQNMYEANNRARRIAARSQQVMVLLLLAGMIIAAGFVFFFGKWVLRPINRLIQSTEGRSGSAAADPRSFFPLTRVFSVFTIDSDAA